MTPTVTAARMPRLIRAYHHCASPETSRIGCRIAEKGGIQDSTVTTGPVANIAPKNITMSSIVTGKDVDWMSSCREASAPDTAYNAAIIVKPAMKKTTNQISPEVRPGSMSPQSVKLAPTI